MAPIRWTKAISLPQELEGGARSTPTFNFTSQGAFGPPWLVKLKFGVLRAPPSSSCGGLVAFGYQMGALWAPWLVKLKFGALRAPPSSSCGGLRGPLGPSGGLRPPPK